MFRSRPGSIIQPIFAGQSAFATCVAAQATTEKQEEAEELK
jgi:hypothetical protein